MVILGKRIRNSLSVYTKVIVIVLAFVEILIRRGMIAQPGKDVKSVKGFF